MRHKFPDTPVPEGEDEIIVTCLLCDTQLVRKATGSKSYLLSTGSRTANAPQCSGKKGVVIGEASVIPINRKAIYFTEAEAKLVDALVIIKAMFGDMCEAKVKTRSSEMARRFLESMSFKELTKEIELKAMGKLVAN